MRLIKSLLLTLLLLFCNISFAAIEAYQFDDDKKTERFQNLTEVLRCPKCQNQNIADSNAEIARDLRNKIEQMLVADKTDDEIVSYMVERYGDFVLYEPRVDVQTYLLWFGPIFVLICGFIVVFFIVRSRQQKTIDDNQSELNSQQKQQLDSLLDKQRTK